MTQHNVTWPCVIISFVSPFSIVTTVSVSVLIVSVISTAIITSIIVWCVMRRRRPSSHATATTDHDKEQVTELATVIYDTPNVIKEHSITTQDNVAYGGTIPLKHNEAYQQVNILTDV